MTDKVINIFNKQPVETEVDKSELEEIINELVDTKDTIADLIVIVVTDEDKMFVKSSNMTTETAYYLLGLAKINALTQ
jgi:hypothetical protein